MENLVRTVSKPCLSGQNEDAEKLREWIVTNGLGGYASGTVCGVPTRRYHGLLISALPSPHGRTMLLNQVQERLTLPGGAVKPLTGEDSGDAPPVTGKLVEFRLDTGLPVWRYDLGGGRVLEKRLILPHLQNTVFLTYTLIEPTVSGPDDALRLTLRPLVHFRGHDAPVNSLQPGPYGLTAWGDRYEISMPAFNVPPLRMTLLGHDFKFTLETEQTGRLHYRLEEQRGYESSGEMWSPGEFRLTLAPGSPVTLVASSESWETMFALTPDEALRSERGRRRRLIKGARHRFEGFDIPASVPGRVKTTEGEKEGFDAELVLAADQFVITPAGRVEDTARAHAAGEEVRTVIAGYHWFTDWGRDTMISLEGLTLSTGRSEEAGYILRTFAHYVQDGLIPNMFPEGGKSGLYHTADASLWFFHAVDRYVTATGDITTLHALLPCLTQIADRHIKGTRFGIGVDPADGLLRQGAEGYQLTWMDAKVGDWVVTPRRGKAVEINALWYNALMLLQGWVSETRGEAAARVYVEHAERALNAFNTRFWHEEGGYLYDVVDGENGNDPACRPNQLFAISLKNPILDPSRWKPVVEVARERLLTPFGLRSLASGHPDYKPRYFGDLRARDAAYHQGTVWAWLIGPFIDAWLKVYPEDCAGSRRFLEGFIPHLSEGGMGTIGEIFDAEPPYTPRGCISQAWSVAEVLRSWIKTGS